jgi:hypothetical protein
LSCCFFVLLNGGRRRNCFRWLVMVTLFVIHAAVVVMVMMVVVVVMVVMVIVMVVQVLFIFVSVVMVIVYRAGHELVTHFKGLPNRSNYLHRLRLQIRIILVRIAFKFCVTMTTTTTTSRMRSMSSRGSLCLSVVFFLRQPALGDLSANRRKLFEDSALLRRLKMSESDLIISGSVRKDNFFTFRFK